MLQVLLIQLEHLKFLEIVLFNYVDWVLIAHCSNMFIQ